MAGNPNVADKRPMTGGLRDLLKVKQLGSSRTRMRAGCCSSPGWAFPTESLSWLHSSVHRSLLTTESNTAHTQMDTINV